MSSLKGDIQIAPAELFASSSTQATDLGARVTTGDGRVFRYASGSGTALVAGKVYQAWPQDTTNLQLLGVSAAAGTLTTSVSTGSSVTLAQNELAGGFLTVRSGSGQGFTYKIKSNPAVTSGTVTFTLEDQIQIALTTASVIDVTPNPYSNVILAPTTLTGSIVGVAINNTTASNFGWLQTRGPCAVLIDASAPTVGAPVKISPATSGAVAFASGTDVVLGTMMQSGVSAKYQPVFLTIE